MIVVGEKIKQAREAKGLSQEFIAEQLGISQAAYSNIERGETQPKLPRLQQLADILAVDMQDLLKLDDNITLNIQTNHGVQAIYYESRIRTIQAVYSENKELLQQLIDAKDKQIAMLEAELSLYKKQKGAATK